MVNVINDTKNVMYILPSKSEPDSASGPIFRLGWAVLHQIDAKYIIGASIAPNKATTEAYRRP